MLDVIKIIEIKFFTHDLDFKRSTKERDSMKKKIIAASLILLLTPHINIGKTADEKKKKDFNFEVMKLYLNLVSKKPYRLVQI